MVRGLDYLKRRSRGWFLLDLFSLLGSQGGGSLPRGYHRPLFSATTPVRDVVGVVAWGPMKSKRSIIHAWMGMKGRVNGTGLVHVWFEERSEEGRVCLLGSCGQNIG